MEKLKLGLLRKYTFPLVGDHIWLEFPVGETPVVGAEVKEGIATLTYYLPRDVELERRQVSVERLRKGLEG